jgi:two-component system, chemotaxis family, response regulator PixG
MNSEQQLALQNILWSQQQQDPLFSSGLSALYPAMLMNRPQATEQQESQRFHPLSLFAQFTDQKSSGCLQVVSNSLVWCFYLEAGKLTFATDSVNPAERLDRHLAYLSQQIPPLVSALRAEVRNRVHAAVSNQPNALPADYQAIAWLVEQHYLSREQAAQLIQQLAQEVLEAFLKLTEGTHEFIEQDGISQMASFCQLDLRHLVDACQTQLRQQQPAVPSSYQDAKPNSGAIAQAPSSLIHSAIPPNQGEAAIQAKKLHRVACIDDSPTVLNAINSFLDPEYFSIVMINDPLKALMQIIRCKPDLILLDIGMPNLDGYELCSLLRKHSHFKNTPIVMVTGNTGFIDRAKAKLVGASGYLTKPFTRAELMKMVFRYLE